MNVMNAPPVPNVLVRRGRGPPSHLLVRYVTRCFSFYVTLALVVQPGVGTHSIPSFYQTRSLVTGLELYCLGSSCLVFWKHGDVVGEAQVHNIGSNWVCKYHHSVICHTLNCRYMISHGNFTSRRGIYGRVSLPGAKSVMRIHWLCSDVG